MRLVITGAGGLLGRPLVRLARAQGHEVTGVVRRAESVTGAEPDVVVLGDLRNGVPAGDWAGLRGAAVIHLAAETNVREARDFETNEVLCTTAACAIARQTGGRLVYVSSGTVYSGPGTRRPVTRLDETAPAEPAGAYGRAKLAGERIVAGAGIPGVTLRLFAVLSHTWLARPGRGHMLQAIAQGLATGQPLRLRTDAAGQAPVRDYVHEQDAVARILLAATMAGPLPPVVNLCTGVATDLRELAETAQACAGRKFPLQVEPWFAGENEVMVGDPALGRAVFGATPAGRVREFCAEAFGGGGQPTP